ncbi:MAG: hypothetical protein AAF411_15450 [Myxococcota bacterium]
MDIASTTPDSLTMEDPCIRAEDAQPTVRFEPVVASSSTETTTFEGFPVRARYPPGELRGLVVFFHGSGGSASFLDRIETRAFVEELLAADYGSIATESTQRDEEMRWSASPETPNADVERVTRLVRQTLSERGLAADHPLFLVGMSNGAGFVGTLAEALSVSDLNLRAVMMQQNPWRRDVFEAGAPTVPTFHVSVANESVSDLPRARAQVAQAQAENRGPVVDTVAEEVPLDPRRFLRIPGFTEARANAFFMDLVQRDLIDAAGQRLANVDQLEASFRRTPDGTLSFEELRDVRSQILVTWAMHQMRSDYSEQAVAFFECHRSQ